MLKSFIGIESETNYTLIVEKSKFLCFAIPVFSKAEINARLESFRRQYPDATHVCYAYIVNDDGVQEKYSDDGEPSGTAGAPICMVLKKRNLTNILVVVVRYFGGKKLGAGGLVRTYSACASGVLDSAVIHNYFLSKRISFSIDASEYYKYVSMLSDVDIKTRNEVFEEDKCVIQFGVYDDVFAKFIAQLKNINPQTEIRSEEIYL